MVAALCLCDIADLSAQSPHTRKRNYLTSELAETDLPALLTPLGDWQPYPRAGDAGWEQVPDAVRGAHIDAAEQLLGTSWPALPATVLLEYVRTGNRSNYQALANERREKLAKLVVAEAMENRGRFMDDILNGIWTISEETYWGVPAHLSLQQAGSGLPDVNEPTVDLFAAETGSLLAWTDYLLGDKLDALSPLIRQRIRSEVDRRILSPNLDREDFWWMGFEGGRINNWNPWINSNWLTMVLLLESDEARRHAAVYKIMRSLDLFINSYPVDGGCDEGPGYWGRAAGSMFDTLELLHSASDGNINIFDKPLIKAMGSYIYLSYIADQYFINFADAKGKITVEPALIYRYGKMIEDERMTGFASFAARQQDFGAGFIPGVFGHLNRQLPAFFVLDELASTPPFEPLFGDIWLPDVEVVMTREKHESREGFYLAVKGGHNDESHNHNDIGSFMVYHNGHPVFVDAGVGQYTAKTFSSERYDIWSMQSAFHNLPTVNGVMQEAGPAFKARDVIFKTFDERTRFQLNLRKAYPEAAQMDYWLRTFTLIRGEHIVLDEKYVLREFIEPYTLSFMTPRKVRDKKGALVLRAPKGKSALPAEDVTLTYDPNQFDVILEEIPLEDASMQSVWGPQLTRILLVSKAETLTGEHQIFIKAE